MANQHFYQPADIAAATGRSERSVYYHHRQLRERDLIEPISDEWPLERTEAQRLIQYMKIKRRRKKSVSVIAQ